MKITQIVFIASSLLLQTTGAFALDIDINTATCGELLAGQGYVQNPSNTFDYSKNSDVVALFENAEKTKEKVNFEVIGSKQRFSAIPSQVKVVDKYLTFRFDEQLYTLNTSIVNFYPSRLLTLYKHSTKIPAWVLQFDGEPTNSSLLFFQGPLPEVPIQIQLASRNIHFIQNEESNVNAIISTIGLGHDKLALRLPEGSTILGGTRYSLNDDQTLSRSNSTIYGHLAGEMIQYSHFSFVATIKIKKDLILKSKEKMLSTLYYQGSALDSYEQEKLKLLDPEMIVTYNPIYQVFAVSSPNGVNQNLIEKILPETSKTKGGTKRWYSDNGTLIKRENAATLHFGLLQGEIAEDQNFVIDLVD